MLPTDYDRVRRPRSTRCRGVGADVRCLPWNATTVRFVTHLDVSRDDVQHAVTVARNIVR
jgi:threonine aldolase